MAEGRAGSEQYIGDLQAELDTLRSSLQAAEQRRDNAERESDRQTQMAQDRLREIQATHKALEEAEEERNLALSQKSVLEDAYEKTLAHRDAAQAQADKLTPALKGAYAELQEQTAPDDDLMEQIREALDG